MLRMSPVKLLSGVAAVLLGAGGLFYACQARQGAADMFDIARANLPAKRAPAQHPASETPRVSSERVIPIGVATPPPPSAEPRPAGR